MVVKLSCEETVLASWNHTIGTNPNKDIIAKVEKCGTDLSWWNWNVFGSIRKELTRKRDMSLRAENEAMINGNNSWVRELNFEIVKLLFTTLCFFGLYFVPNLIVMLFNLLCPVGFHCKGCVLEKKSMKTQANED